MRTHALAILALLTINLVIKYSLWTQPPQTFTDSLSYLAPAISLLDGRGYGSQENSFRTPTYPLFLTAILAPTDHHVLSQCREARVPECLGGIQDEPNADANLRAIVAVQIILGMLTIPLVYFFAWQIARNVWIAALCALTYPLDLSTGYWEISILTETLSTFLLMLVAALAIFAESAPRRRAPTFVALGVTLAALGLCHLAFLGYAIVPVAFLFFRVRPRVLIAPVLLIPALCVLGWSARNYVVDGYFTPTTISGINLTQMVGAFMEQAPPQDRDLAEIYLDYRAERLAQRGTHSGTIYFAYREMMAARGITWSELSKELGAMSVQMILQNPRGYLETAQQSWQQFWKFGLGKQNPTLPLSFDWVKWFFDSRVQQALAFLFFLTPFALMLVPRYNDADVRAAFWIGFAIATVLYAALFSAALSFGDTERYRTHVARLQYSAIILTATLLLRAQRSNLQVAARRLLHRNERSSQ